MLTRRRSIALAVAAALATLAVACGGSDDDDSWSAQAIAPDPETIVMPILANSQLGVGPNRIAFALFDREGALVSGATVALRLYALDVAEDEAVTGTMVSEHQLTAVTLSLGFVHEHEDGSAHTHSGANSTIYSTQANLSRAEWWGAELSVELDGQRTEGLRLRFWVSERTDEPMLGEPAPASEQLVLRDVADVTEIDTSNPPIPELHDVTVAEALDAGRPLVVAFATPAFCQTRFCGPVIDEVVRPLYERYGDQAQFIHIEPFDVMEARAGRLLIVPAMEEWRLSTEPWVFVIDASGRVAAKFEGITSAEEVAASLVPLLDGGP